MTAACTFDAIPRSITSGGSVRFFPRVSGFTKPIAAYDWDFGDGTAHGTDATPIHTYPAVLTYTTYDIVLTVTDSNGGTATLTINDFIASDASGNIPAIATDGTYHQVSVLVFDDTNSMVVNRNPWTGCHIYLLTPKTVDSIDKIGTATLSLLDVGDSTATERGLMAEGKNIVFITGKSITFSGKIRRITQNTQSGFASSTRIKLWDVECDSDLAKPQQINIDSSVLDSSGAAIYDTPGNIARLVLTPTSPARDTRGVINCVDAKIGYQLNSSNSSESAGNQYDHLMALQAQNNYDTRSRPDFLLYKYSTFADSGAGGDPESLRMLFFTRSIVEWLMAPSWTLPSGFPPPTFTISGMTAAVNEFVGMYALFVGRDAPASKTFTTNYAVNNDRLLVSTASTFFAVNDRVTLSTTGAMPTGLSATTYYVTAVTSTYLTISTSRGGSSVTFSTNGSGTHSIILKAETSGVMAYGKITANDATTITCTGMVNSAVIPQSLGYVLIYRGYLIDFAHDLSQPSVIKNLDINKDVFEFSDNDDKRKLSTKIVATGKDLQGKTISVAIAGVHAYNTTKQYFDDSTYISKASEGYVYANSYVVTNKSCTALLGDGGTVFTTNYAGGDHYSILISSSSTKFKLNAQVQFIKAGGTLPSNLNETDFYYIVARSSGAFAVSLTLGGAQINIGSDATGTVYTACFPQMQVDNSDGSITLGTQIVFNEGTMPSLVGSPQLTPGTIYTCGTPGYSSSSYVFYVMSGATKKIWDNVGSGIKMYLPSLIINPGASSAPKLWLYGWGYAMLTGMTLIMSIPYGSYQSVTITDTGTEMVSKDGAHITEFSLLVMPVGLDSDYSQKGYLMSNKLWVHDKSLYTSGTVNMLVGEEPIPITGSGTDTTYGDYFTCDVTLRIMSSSLKSYPHGVGAMVALMNYTEASPQTGSPIQQYGFYIDARTVDNNITYGVLDAYANSLLLGLGNFYKKATTQGPMILASVPHVGEFYAGISQASLQEPPRISERVSFTEYTGATPVEYQIVAVTLDYDSMTVTLELGDFEKNVFTSLQQSTNAVNRTIT